LAKKTISADMRFVDLPQRKDVGNYNT
jgi:hypothetical protein